MYHSMQLHHHARKQAKPFGAFHKCFFVDSQRSIVSPHSPSSGQICKFNDSGKVCPIGLLYRLHGDPAKYRHRDLETQGGRPPTSMEVTIQPHCHGFAPENSMPGKNCFAFLKGQRQRWVSMQKHLFIAFFLFFFFYFKRKIKRNSLEHLTVVAVGR